MNHKDVTDASYEFARKRSIRRAAIHGHLFLEEQTHTKYTKKICKIESDDTRTLANARDRGGLWRVNKNMQALLLKSECIFRSKTAQFSVKIICADIVKSMFKNCHPTSKQFVMTSKL